jgi:CHAT domain-containing protein
MRSRRRRSVGIFVAILVCISCLIAIVLLPTPERRYARMIQLAGKLDRRPVEARIVGFPYAPFVVSRGTASTHTSDGTVNFRGAAGEFLVNTQPLDGHIHERAVATLVTMSPKEAVEMLEAAASQSSADASILCDLSAARLAWGSISDDMELFASALAAADAALRHNPQSPEARFNRALALDRLRLHEPAAAAYQRYLDVDSTSDWSVEARRNLARCTYEPEAIAWNRMRAAIERIGADTTEIERAVRLFPYDSRAWGEAAYLSSWAENVRAGREVEADRMLALARRIGAALKSQSGECLLSDAVSAIDRADTHTRGILVDAYLMYKNGRKLLSSRRPADAKTPLDTSRTLFQRANSPMAFVAQYYVANAAVDLGDDDSAQRLLSTVCRATPEQYQSLTAEIALKQGLVLARNGRVHEALELTQFAAAAFARIGEGLFQTQSQISTATALTILGRPADAWKLRRTIMESVSRSGDRILFEHALNTAARDALSDHHPEIAESLINVELTRKTTSARLRVDALLCRIQATSASELASGAPALRTAVTEIADAALREEALDDIRIAEAAAIRAQNPQLAERLISQTIAFRTARSNQLTLPAAYVEHARTLRVLGRDTDAIADLEKAIENLEQQRQTIAQEEFRDSFGRNTAAAYDELFDIRAARGEYDHAFAASERGRARRIMERLRAPDTVSTAPLHTSEELRNRIPRGVVLAEFSVLSDRIVALTLDTRGLRAHVTHVSAAQIASERNALLEALSRKDSDASNVAAARLYGRLMSPIAADLGAAEEVVIVPDAATASIPFAMLKNTTTGRYLIEEYALTFAPSAAAYVDTVKRPKPALPLRPLIVGDPEFREALFPGLQRLQNAEGEARQIAAFYPGAEVRTGAAATRESIIASMESAGLVHIGAHAIANDSDPSLSVILLAPDRDGDGLLYVRDVAALRLKNSPVVILAGCRTASATNSAASIGSLATAFLAAGARTVVGALWDVDDDVAADASIALHQAMKRGERPSIALRNVQLQMLRSSNPRTQSARSWSGMQSYGSGD